MNAQVDFALTPHVAKTLITQVMSLLGRDVSLTDETGAVVASFDPRTVGSTIAGVDSVLQSSEAQPLQDSQAVGFALAYDSNPVGVLVIHADPESVKEFIPITRSLVELLIEQQVAGKLPGNLDQLLWQFFHSLSDAERDRLVADIKLLGVDLTKPRFVVLVQVPGFGEQLSQSSDKVAPITRFKDKLAREVTAIFPTSHDNTITYFGSGMFLLLKDASRGQETLELFRQKCNAMLKNVGQQLSAGIGSIYLGTEGLTTSFREAETALRLGIKLHQPGKAYYIDDLGLFIVFGEVGSDKQIQLAKRLLAPLLKEADLVKTVKAYFAENLNLTKAAEHLHIHRNTLIYRLGKIKDLVQLDPQNFEDAVQLKLALTLMDLE